MIAKKHIRRPLFFTGIVLCVAIGLYWYAKTLDDEHIRCGGMPTQEVLVVTNDVYLGEYLKPSDVKMKAVPRKFVDNWAMNESSTTWSKYPINRDLRAGSQLSETHFLSEEACAERGGCTPPEGIEVISIGQEKAKRSNGEPVRPKIEVRRR